MKTVRLYAILGSSAILVSACMQNEEKRAYVTPSDVCGVKIQQESLSGLLPPGESVEMLSAKKDDWSDRSRPCRVLVDGKAALRVRVARDTADTDAADLKDTRWVDFQKFSLAEIAASAGAASEGGVASLECRPKAGSPAPNAPGSSYSHLVVRVHVDTDAKPSGEAERRANVEKFMRSYIPEVSKTWCS